MSDYKEIYGEDDERHQGKPHGWIQWKGTQPCMDMHCACGAHGHIDADYFFYYYKCAACGQKYAVGQNVVLHPLTEQQVAKIDKERNFLAPDARWPFDPDLLDDDDGNEPPPSRTSEQRHE